jgi:hypothetical protein
MAHRLHPRAERQGQCGPDHETDRGQQRHLRRRRVQHQDRDQREGVDASQLPRVLAA